MMQIADLHIHSRYSRATSRDCVPEELDYYARRKGITILGTGDFTHPAWRQELSEKLVPAEEGLYVLREEFVRPEPVPQGSVQPRFVLSGEISSIYKQDGKTRKVHNLILLPSLEAAEVLSRRLEAIGNIHSDGRPILGISSRDLLEITLEACPDAIFIPAHIWTPHFSVFGAFSGFETMEECFGDLAGYIHAVETGLSSDPAMNWRVPALDGYQLVSNSDAHSPQKLGREANLLDIETSYPALSDALSGKNPTGLAGTIEFFPEEGKYHYDGHRNCHICLKPAETAIYGGRCPVCGRKLTIGVEHRVEELARRPEGYRPVEAKPYESLVPLAEAIAWSTGTSPNGVRAAQQYEVMLQKLGTEFHILRESSLEEIREVAGDVIAEGIRRLRAGEVEKIPGYDGEYGVIRLLQPEEVESLSGQVSLFGAGIAPPKKAAKKRVLPVAASLPSEAPKEQVSAALSPNPAQQQAIDAVTGVTAVIAGPGSGKTRTLVLRIAHLIRDCGVKPSQITAVTFTRKAAEELQERLEKELGGKKAMRGLVAGTFHSICLNLLPGPRPALVDSERALEFAAQVLQELGCGGDPRAFLQEASRARNGCPVPEAQFPAEAPARYAALLEQEGLTDFDGLLERGAAWYDSHPTGANFSHVLVDEFQDSNPIQYQLVRLWAQKADSLFVIGDPDQAIYGFRGADSRCFDRLAEDFPALQVIRLTENYRSSPEIVSTAIHVMGGARTLHPNCPSGGPIQLVRAANPMAEGIFAAKEISRLTGGIDMLEARSDQEETVRSFSDIAILCRTRRQLELVEKCLRHDDIPCRIVGQGSFLSDEQVQGITGFFAFLQHPFDANALKHTLRLVKCPPDIQEALCRKIRETTPQTLEEVGTLMGDYRELAVMQKWFGLFDQYASGLGKEKPHKLLEAVACELELSEQEPISQLIAAAAFQPDMPSLLEALASGEEDAFIRLSGRQYSSGAVTLMTLHGAKGLEFPVVFLYGVEEGSLPLTSAAYPVDLEEERRLFFVGITRAKQRLFLLTSGEPSEFLDGMPESLLHQMSAAPPRPESSGIQLSLF